MFRLPLHLGLLAQAQHRAGRFTEARATLNEVRAAVELRGEYAYLHPRLPVGRVSAALPGRGGDRLAAVFR
ncbi:hypothetical protein [Kitasatospora sp. HPMI-4]|uniref:hypothetical protein n=1 Tax=Kitasatospora sp. HPMI-4 TaxID=3448443 RepID=UPI003F1DD7C3